MVSILICTRNRAASLAQTLEAIGKVTVPPHLPAELIVIDNGSTDATAAIVHNARLPNMTVRHVREPRIGQVHARNRGLREAAGRVVLFTDDDVRPPLNWIDGMCGPIVRGEAEAVAGGVRMAPHLERRWLSQTLRQWLACTDGIDPKTPGRLVGANMAFSRSVLEKVTAFDAELGPGALGYFDDTLFSLQLTQAGYRIVSALDVAVEHHFDEDRLESASLLKAAARLGRSHAYMFYHWEHRRLRLPLLRFVIESARHALNTLTNRALDWKLESVKRMSFAWQYLREVRRTPAYERHGLIKRAGIE